MALSANSYIQTQAVLGSLPVPEFGRASCSPQQVSRGWWRRAFHRDISVLGISASRSGLFPSSVSTKVKTDPLGRLWNPCLVGRNAPRPLAMMPLSPGGIKVAHLVYHISPSHATMEPCHLGPHSSPPTIVLGRVRVHLDI